jgi:hypothetical protein
MQKKNNLLVDLQIINLSQLKFRTQQKINKTTKN